tara:strand:+ start:31 stop:1911 length:1881 start_codon:yes stop_codon:yes gene_type:complete
MNNKSAESSFFEGTLCALSTALFIITPLFYLELKQDEWVTGFIPIRMVNAELKLSVFVLLGSLLIGLIWARCHLQKGINAYSTPFLFFTGIFLLSVIFSTISAHNTSRALVSSFTWHIIPILFAISFTQVKWTSNKIITLVSVLLLGGILSSLVVMDQHYQFTNWSHKLPRVGYGGLIYNQNFAAEYHAPFLPLLLGLIYFTRIRAFKVILLFVLIVILLPALSLSLARGAWVGFIMGCGLTGIILLFLNFLGKSSNRREFTNVLRIPLKCGLVIGSFLLLALALPLYLTTSNYWKKGAFSKEIKPGESSAETEEFKSITDLDKKASGGAKRRFVLWQDALEASLSKDFLLGKGTDHYELHFHESAKLSDRTTGSTLVRFVHNDFLQILYENGIIGLIGFLGMWGVVLIKGFKMSFECMKEKDFSHLGLIIGLLAACLTFLIESFFEFPTRSPCALLLGWTCFGLLLTLSTNNKNTYRIGKISNLFVGSGSILIILFGAFLAKNLFWTNVYHFQGRIAGDYGEKDKSLKFHKKAINYAPWEHHSRKFESFYLLTHKKHFPEALDAINETIRVHPGCLVAHQNKITVLLNEFNDRSQALEAYHEMKKNAPFHPYTKNESKKFAENKR